MYAKEYKIIHEGLKEWITRKIKEKGYLNYLISFDKDNVNFIFKQVTKEITKELPNVYIYMILL